MTTEKNRRCLNLNTEKHQPKVLHHSGQHPCQLVHRWVLVAVETKDESMNELMRMNDQDIKGISRHSSYGFFKLQYDMSIIL